MYQLPPLPYGYNALEPVIDEETLHLHYDKHHQTYLDKLNAALAKYPDLAEQPIEELLKNLNQVPEDVRLAVRNFGGGFANHNLFWEILKSPAGEVNLPTDGLSRVIDESFGNFEELKKQLSEMTINHFGSGYGWLVIDKDKKLKILSTANQDSPFSEGLTPLLNIDVWEHAYYLKYKNKRADFVEAIWQIFDWQKISEKFEESL